MRVVPWIAGVTLLLMTVVPCSHALDLEWAGQMSGPTTFALPAGVALDGDANVYTVGRFEGTVDFDPGPGIFNLSSCGSNDDMYISKVDSTGGFLWAHCIGGSAYDYARDVAVDSYGNVYMVGRFRDSIDFDPGAGTYNLTAQDYEAFILKLDSAGGYIWAKQLGGGDLTEIQGVAVDEADNVVTVGTFIGTADFDPGSGSYELTCAGNGDAFVSKLDSAGNFVWARQLGGAIPDLGESVAVDATSNIHVLGSFMGTADFDPGPGVYNLTSAGGDDLYIAKLNSAGELLWAGRIGGESDEYVENIALDTTGSVYVVGSFENTVDIDPGPATFNLSSRGEWDGFIAKLDSSGSFVWGGQIGGALTDYTFDIALSGDNTIYAIGSFRDTVDFDPGFGIFEMTTDSPGGYVLELDGAGSFNWVGQMGRQSSNATASRLALDDNCCVGVHVVGSFMNTGDFDPGPGMFNLTSAGNSATYVSKLRLTPGIEMQGEYPVEISFRPYCDQASFDVALGFLSDLREDEGYYRAGCLGVFVQNPAEEYLPNPPEGDAWYYLARGLNDCLSDGYGDSSIVPDPRDELASASPCP